MFERLMQVNATSGESQEVVTARKIAAIVATLTDDTTGFSKFDHRTLPASFPTKLIGYMHGFSATICAAWRVDKSEVSSAATRFAASCIFPFIEAHDIDRIVDQIDSATEFSVGREAGLADGESYVTTGRRGTALIDLLMDQRGGEATPESTLSQRESCTNVSA
jgi:hypothetical protein